jgi:hypothetical protein
MITAYFMHSRCPWSRLIISSWLSLVLLRLYLHPVLIWKENNVTGRSSEFGSSHRVVDFPPPKVVILPGPHKTGSTSLQTCLVDWTWNWLSRNIRERKDHPVQTPLALPHWAWAVPDESTLRKMKLKHVYPTKAFADVIGMTDLDPTLCLSPQGRSKTGAVITAENVTEVIKLFRTSTEEAWREGKNII